MKQIDISTKKYPSTFALVDDDDYHAINIDKWHPTEDGRTMYATRTDYSVSPPKTVRMHRQILGLKKGEEGDHVDGNGLNNQRYNLRASTRQQNACNTRKSISNSSGYKGVSWCKRSKKWKVGIAANNQALTLGRFTCLIKAAKAYDKAATEYFGEFARLNFPKSQHLRVS